MKKIYENFTNLYPLSKTLRFELIPQGKTLENLKINHIIENDENKAEKYKKAKKIIDKYHKFFIDECMENYNIPIEDLEEYLELYNSKEKDKLNKQKEKMRKDISLAFTKNKLYNEIFSKKIITKILPAFDSNVETNQVLEEFTNFFTYFKGFNENRKNMYVAEEKSTAIAYRLINENLPMVVENINKFKYAQNIIGDSIKKVEEDLNEYIQVEHIEDMFQIEYFNDVLTQKGIEIYNTIIGGKSKEDGTKIKGINEYINEYKQKNPTDKKIAELNILFKQVLAEKDTASFKIDKFNTDQEVLEQINELTMFLNKKDIYNGIETILKNIEEYDLSKIYIKNDLSITNISQFLYDDWSLISKTILQEYDNKNGIPNTKKKENNKKKYLKERKNLSIEFLNNCTKDTIQYKPVQEYFKECIVGEIKKENVFEKINNAYNKLENLIKSEYPSEKNLREDSVNIEKIKNYLDALKELQIFIKPLVYVRFDEGLEKDNEFYDELFKYWDCLLELNSIYNKVRNYLTGKPYSTDKIKLNFNNPTLLDGWDVNKETANKSIILRKNNLYYLVILDKSFKGTLKTKSILENDDYEKMDYKQLPGPNKMLPKVFFADSNIEKFKPSKELLRKYGEGQHKKGEKFNIDFCHELIDFFKESIEKHEDWKKFEFEFSNTSEYNGISEFYKEVEKQGYKISFSAVDSDYLEQAVDNGQVYLFQIYNKDFSKYSHGKPNLHTMYWNELFSEENLNDVVYKLNGEAEIFYRKASLKRNVTHPKNVKINNKNINNPTKQSEFEYDLIKDKRYTEDKFQLHIPISLNFKAQGISNINELVNKEIKNTDENYVIGIDRGERHLLYLVLINSKGEIIEQYTLNEIINENKGVEYKTDYHKLLDDKEKERENARESWQTIENIKNLKEGYLSQVINKISDLMIKYNAIVVLEDLNFGFMRGRQKFEKQVYQKFEKMLIDKLNYLVKKDIKKDEFGGVLRAYQLTNMFESFRKLGKQSGFLYYIPAWNTSKTDPVTGFVNLFYIKYENEEKTKEFFKAFDDIRFNKEKDYFEFDIDYKKYTNKAEGTKEKWTICSYGDRIKTLRNKDKNNQWDSVKVDLTQSIKKLLEENFIDIFSNKLKAEILNIEGKEFWEKFLNLFKLCLQMRNSVTGTEEDYIISPVCDENGNFFDSRIKNDKLPKNADANGAYNIARKGLWAIRKIKNTSDEELRKVDLAITNKEWLKFIQEKEYND